MLLKKYDKGIAIVFGILTIGFLILAFTNDNFLNWVFERHHNQLSWYVRPLFLIPFCFFAYKKSWAGIAITIFSLFTSMFWFPEPKVVSEQVKEFLAYEVDYLTGDWGLVKVLLSLLVPVSFFALGTAFWKRNLWIGLSVVALMAIGKMLWSVGFAGESGKSIMIPAVLGLMLTVGFVFWGFKRLENRKQNHDI